jgi:MOSC domain-containing protein YiiM
MVRKFLDSERSGFYLRVLQEGCVEAGDAIRLAGRSQDSETISDMVRMKKRTE